MGLLGLFLIQDSCVRQYHGLGLRRLNPIVCGTGAANIFIVVSFGGSHLRDIPMEDVVHIYNLTVQKKLSRNVREHALM